MHDSISTSRRQSPRFVVRQESSQSNFGHAKCFCSPQQPEAVETSTLSQVRRPSQNLGLAFVYFMHRLHNFLLGEMLNEERARKHQPESPHHIAQSGGTAYCTPRGKAVGCIRVLGFGSGATRIQRSLIGCHVLHLEWTRR
jgi:uncharacterized protein YgiB involved in biofilm formation